MSETNNLIDFCTLEISRLCFYEPLAIFPMLSATLDTSYKMLDYTFNPFISIKRCRSNMTFLLITRQFICAPNLSSVKGDGARTKKIRQSMIHTANLVRIAIDTANFDSSLCHCVIVCTSSHHHLLIVLLQAEKKIRF